MVSGVSQAAGQKNGQINRYRNFDLAGVPSEDEIANIESSPADPPQADRRNVFYLFYIKIERADFAIVAEGCDG
jgi:hypothetical protein